MKAELDAKFGAFQTCEDMLTKSTSTSASFSNDATSLKNDLCTCWQEEAAAKLNHQVCADELKCRNVVVERKLKEQNAFILDGDTPVDQYTDASGASSVYRYAWFEQGRRSNRLV